MSSLLITEGLGGEDTLLMVSFTPAATTLTLTFSDPVDLTGASAVASEWSISGAPSVSILSIEAAGSTITITTTEHGNGASYTLLVPPGIVDANTGDPFIGPFSIPYTGVGISLTLAMVRGVDARTVEVVFTEAVNESDASLPENYSIHSPAGVSVLAASKVTDVTYRLTTTVQLRSRTYTLTASGIRDLSGAYI